MNRTELLDYIHTEEFKSALGFTKRIEVVRAIEALSSTATDAVMSNRGYEVCHKSMAERIGKFVWILQAALDSEEKHYDNEDTKPGWFDEAREIIARS